LFFSLIILFGCVETLSAASSVSHKSDSDAGSVLEHEDDRDSARQHQQRKWKSQQIALESEIDRVRKGNKAPDRTSVAEVINKYEHAEPPKKGRPSIRSPSEERLPEDYNKARALLRKNDDIKAQNTVDIAVTPKHQPISKGQETPVPNKRSSNGVSMKVINCGGGGGSSSSRSNGSRRPALKQQETMHRHEARQPAINCLEYRCTFTKMLKCREIHSIE
jgi:hypothetical protein